MSALEKLLSMDPSDLKLLSQIINHQNMSCERPKVEVVKMIECEKPCTSPIAQIMSHMNNPSMCTTTPQPTFIPTLFQPPPITCQAPTTMYCTEIAQPQCMQQSMPHSFMTTPTMPAPSYTPCASNYCTNCKCCSCQQANIYQLI